jgi:hypothetical protein
MRLAIKNALLSLYEEGGIFSIIPRHIFAVFWLLSMVFQKSHSTEDFLVIATVKFVFEVQKRVVVDGLSNVTHQFF